MTGKRWAMVHLALTGLWASALIPTLLWWRDSILWVALMSVYACLTSHWAAYQAARAEGAEEERRNGKQPRP